APLYLQRKARRGPTFREVLLVHAVARIVYRGLIDNVQFSWVKLGPAAGVQRLQAGCNDLGGTLMDENISRAAGATHGQEMTPEDFAALAEPLGRTLQERTTLYERGERRPAGASAGRLPCRTTSASTSAPRTRPRPAGGTAGSSRRASAAGAPPSRRPSASRPACGS